jgi:hypothetical protein
MAVIVLGSQVRNDNDMAERRRKRYEVPAYEGLEEVGHLTEREKQCMRLRFWIAELEDLAFWESQPGDHASKMARSFRVVGSGWTVKYPPPHELLQALAYHRAELAKAEARAHPGPRRRGIGRARKER